MPQNWKLGKLFAYIGSIFKNPLSGGYQTWLHWYQTARQTGVRDHSAALNMELSIGSKWALKYIWRSLDLYMCVSKFNNEVLINGLSKPGCKNTSVLQLFFSVGLSKCCCVHRLLRHWLWKLGAHALAWCRVRPLLHAASLLRQTKCRVTMECFIYKVRDTELCQ